jgi:hypothetical protein
MKGYGLPAKYARHGFKKGWKLYKAARKSTSTAGRKKTSNKSKKKRVVLITNISGAGKGEFEMEGKRRRKTRRTSGRANLLGKRRRKTGKKVSLLGGGIAGKIMDSGLMAIGVIAGTAAGANLPWIKDQKAYIKGLILAAAGLMAMQFIRQPIAKKAAAGIIASGALALASPAFINISPGESIPSFATSGRRFSRDELAALQSMGRPYPIPLGRPAVPPGFSGADKSSYRSRLSTR